jgi:ABC-type polysaccharide/polyol phosphate transport system ATPase subunit
VSGTAVVVDDVSKMFRLYKERNNSIKAALMRGKRAVSEDFWALRDVSFEVPTGGTFGLIGENGSGKSTMLKVLTRILRPDKGSIQVNGKVSALLELGAGFHPELSGRENVFLNGAILGLSQKEIRRRFDDIVEFAGIEQFIDEPVKNYSSGMYVRLGFSVAINVDPEVLLVDEVLAVGDENFQRKCSEKFADLKADGKTIVLVSHSMAAVQNICDSVAWFEHGHLKQLGSPRDVVEQYTGTVQVDREVDAAGHPRWGSGEVRVTLRLHYDAPEPVPQPGFSFLLSTINGAPVTGPNSVAAGCVPDKIEGTGVVEVVMDPLRLLPGTYELSVKVTDRTLLKEYDHRQNVLRFDVERGGIHEDWGVVSLSPRWRIGELEGGT